MILPAYLHIDHLIKFMRSLGKQRLKLPIGLFVVSAVCIVALSCEGSKSNNSNTKPTAGNNAAEPKATPAKTPEPETKPAGREVKVVDGPALKSVIPPDGAVLGGVLNEIATKLPAPEFPSDVKDTGTVVVEVLVNEKGEVGAASAVSGPQPLRAAAVKAAREAKFDPPLKDGNPVKVGGTLTFEKKN